MIPKPDPQSLTRLLTTLGVFLCVVAVVGPALVLRETSVLGVSSKKLDGLTPVAREELERRQRVSRDAGLAAPYVGGVVLVLGLALIGLAIPRLRKLEGADEARSSAELSKLLAELQPQDADDRRAALARDIADTTPGLAELEEAEDEDRPVPVAQGKDMPPATIEDTDARHPAAVRTLGGSAQVDGQMAERRVLQRLTELDIPAYQLRTEVKLGNPSGSALLLDALLYSEIDQLKDVIVEVKLVRPAGFPARLRRITDEALALQRRYETRTGRRAVGWLIMVFDGDAPSTRVIRHVAAVRADMPDLRLSLVLKDRIELLQPPPDLGL